MPINKIFGGGIAMAGNALDIRMEKQGLIQSNIANIETPGYTVKDFSFKNVMESVMTGRGELNRTNSRHIGLDPLDVSESLEFLNEARPVDLDEEMQKLAENQLMYQVTARILTKKFEGIKLAIEEGSK